MTRVRVLAGALAVLIACGRTGPTSPGPPTPGPAPPPRPIPIPAGPEVFVGAGDIGWCGLAGADLTATLLDGIPGAVFAAGDNAYPNGSGENYQRCYDPYWGRHKGRTHPVPGNHDYDDGRSDASAYFNYFGAAAGPPGLGYYSYTVGAWHIVALNSEISAFPGSPQLEWLRNDLTANPSRCALAIFHTPVFGSGVNGGNPHMQAVWRSLYEFGVEVVINGHNHSYERFAPQDPDGAFDPERGIREFVVGTGGAELTDFPRVRPNSEIRRSVWGVLKLTLSSDRYDWVFVPVAGQSFSDSGSANCH
jgi:Calcineurin-like phosphoesterase